MKTYTIYIKQDAQQIVDVQYIPEKFCYLGFFFNLLWLAYQRLWMYTAIFTFLILISSQLSQISIIDSNHLLILYLGICLLIGFIGNDLLRKRLQNQGYKFYDVVIASNESDAEFKFISMNYHNEQFLG